MIGPCAAQHWFGTFSILAPTLLCANRFYIPVPAWLPPLSCFSALFRSLSVSDPPQFPLETWISPVRVY